MKKHTVIFAFLAILLIAVLLAGCGGGDGGTTTTSPAGTTTTPTGTTTSPTVTTTSPTITTTTPPETTPTNTGIPLSEILGQAANYPTVKYDMITTVTGLTTINTVKYWIKNKKFRIEQPSSGLVLLINFEDQTMYLYSLQQKIASSENFDATQAPENPSTMLEYSPKIVGTETIDGETCTVIEYTYAYEQASVKTWISNDTGFPLRMESSASGVTTTVEWKNFDFTDISDSTFELPDNVQIVNLGG
ncbi:MAG: hypothetical protein ABR954_06680 [Dehalococcoidales bacterium]